VGIPRTLLGLHKARTVASAWWTSADAQRLCVSCAGDPSQDTCLSPFGTRARTQTHLPKGHGLDLVDDGPPRVGGNCSTLWGFWNKSALCCDETEPQCPLSAPNVVVDTLAAWFSFLTGCIPRTNWSYPLSFFLSTRAYSESPDHISGSQCDGLCHVTFVQTSGSFKE
jgi:hypothetical protein